MAQVVVVGRVGGDVSVQETRNGDPWAKFSLAESHFQGNEEGQPTFKALWYDVTMFGDQAKNLNTRVTKGMKVVVVGKLTMREYKAKDGTTKQQIGVRAEQVLPTVSEEKGAPAPAAAAVEELPFE